MKRPYRSRIVALALVMLLSPAVGLSAPVAAGPGKGAGPRREPVTKVEITIPHRSDLDRLIEAGYDVARVKGDRVLIYADPEEWESLRAGGWELETLAPGPAAPDLGTPQALGSYNNYADLTAMLDAYATNYPALCRKVSLGKSVQNRDLWAMKVTTDPDVEADKPEFKYIATPHGNEPVGTEMCLYLLDLLLKGYGSNDARIVRLVRDVEIWMAPLMNPDGREYSPPRRYNANGYDLNRSFPEGSGTNYGNWLYGPPMNTNGRPVEVRHVMKWNAAHRFVLGANFHTGTMVVNYPYDNDTKGSVFSPTPDEALLQAMSRAYSSNNPPMWNSLEFEDGIVNGAAWYAVSGGMQDWNYRYDGCFDVTIELSDYQWPDPPASELPVYWSQNRESMLQYLEWVLRGVRGLLRDADTGLPVTGAVRVEGLHHLVFSDPDVGDYHRLLLPGTYTLWFYAPGYVPQRVAGVTVGSGDATRVDVALRPVSPRFAAKINFQPAATATPTGHYADSGAAFGARGNGLSYGWETNLAAGNLVERKAGRSQDLRYDTLCQMQAGGNHVWEIALPNGPYAVLVAAGDAALTGGPYRVAAEGALLLDGATTSSNLWRESLGTVVVTDGRLTLSNAAGAVSNRLNFLEISAVEPAAIGQWRARHFGTTNNAGPAADGADQDADGYPNLLEYAFGFDPAFMDAGSPLSALRVQTNGADRFGAWFYRNTNAADLTFTVQAASELLREDWLDLARFTGGAGWSGTGTVWETGEGSNRVHVAVLDAPSSATGLTRSLRLHVAHP